MGGRERTRGCLNLKESASDRHVVLLVEAPRGADILVMAVAGATNLNARGAPPRSLLARRPPGGRLHSVASLGPQALTRLVSR